MTNSADPDQLASQKPTDLDLHCLLRQGTSCSAREGLILFSYLTQCLICKLAFCSGLSLLILRLIRQVNTYTCLPSYSVSLVKTCAQQILETCSFLGLFSIACSLPWECHHRKLTKCLRVPSPMVYSNLYCSR